MRRWMGWGLLVLALAGCGEDDEHDHGHEHGGGEEALEEEACEHMKDGPFEDVAAAADAAGAPSVNFEHTRVNISLADGDTVTFAADEAGDYVFFLSDDVAFTVTQGGATVAIEESGAVDACGEVAVHHVLELEVGPATIEFGETDLESVGFVAEHAGEEHEHE